MVTQPKERVPRLSFFSPPTPVISRAHTRPRTVSVAVPRLKDAMQNVFIGHAQRAHQGHEAGVGEHGLVAGRGLLCEPPEVGVEGGGLHLEKQVFGAGIVNGIGDLKELLRTLIHIHVLERSRGVQDLQRKQAPKARERFPVLDYSRSGPQRSIGAPPTNTLYIIAPATAIPAAPAPIASEWSATKRVTLANMILLPIYRSTLYPGVVLPFLRDVGACVLQRRRIRATVSLSCLALSV